MNSRLVNEQLLCLTIDFYWEQISNFHISFFVCFEIREFKEKKKKESSTQRTHAPIEQKAIISSANDNSCYGACNTQMFSITKQKTNSPECR